MKHLRKSIVISVIALVAMNFPIPIFGQTTLAIRGGMSRATMSGSNGNEEVDARTGIKVGASATIPMQERFSLQLGGNYVQKGGRGPLEGDDLSLSQNLDYIELSGLGVFNLMPSESAASVYMLAGPAVAFNVKCEVEVMGEFVGEEGAITLTSKTDCEDSTINTVDFGITGGIGTEMAMSERMTFSVELLYTLGILSIAEDVGDVKNRAIALQVGVGFPIGK